MTDAATSAAADVRRRRARWRRWEARALVATTAVGLVHALDERVLRPPAGVDRGSELRWTVALVAVLAVAVLLVRAARPAVGAVVVATLGALFVGDGGTHVVHASSGEVDALDVTGAAAALAGVVLLGLAVVGAFRRSGGPRRRGWRWADRLATLLVVAVLATFLVAPVVTGAVQVHLPRRPVAAPPSEEFLPVTLRAEDGPALQAWYRPSRNGAAVMVLNSARGDHGGSAGHARLLADHGYGVLVYDARGTGGSEGTPNGWGWTWLPDVEAGLDFLSEQPDVADGGVGLLGLSTGADVAIEAAALDPRIRAVVADGATAQGFADRPEGWSAAVSLGPMYLAGRLLTGRSPNAPLEEAIAAVAPRPVLLVAAGSIPQEIPLNRRYEAAGASDVELWELPDVRHTSGLTSRPEEYADRVLGLLDDALLRGR